MESKVFECGINFLSFDRALELVPPEFAIGYEWYQSKEGLVFPRLPHRDTSLDTPEEITICADRGIHSPDYRNLESRGEGKRRYVLSIHSKGNSGPYDDEDVIHREDGTWILGYCAHKTTPGKRETENGNSYLINNFVDGVPVAVLVQQEGGGYKNYGLAYVERYDPATEIFTLHGPVSAEASNADFCSIIPRSELTKEEQRIFADADAGDQRKRVIAEMIRRERQGAFRKKLVDAYGGRCAITGVTVPEVLQAAHVDPYRGKLSQVVTNGMLLRSDIHLLYDSHLLTVRPESNLVIVSKQLMDTPYRVFDGCKAVTPRDPSLRPNDALLEMHMREFEFTEKSIA